MSGPKRATAFTFGVALVSVASSTIFKTTPTLAAADVLVSKDAGNFANITTLPTQVQTTGVLPVALTASEMDAALVYVLFHDAAGAEWADLLVCLNTETGTISEIDNVVDALSTTVGVAGAGLTALGDARMANLDAAVSSRSVYAGGAVASVTGNVGGNVVGSVGSVAGNVVGSVGSVAGGVAGSVGSVAGNVVGSVGSVAANGINAASIATGAIDGDALDVSATDEITDSVWAEALPGAYVAGSAGHILGNLVSGVAGIAAAVWAFAQRTITWPLIKTAFQTGTNEIEALRGDTFSATFSLGEDITARTAFWITVRDKKDDTDPQSLIQVTEAAGLVYLNGAAAAVPANASIVVLDALTGTFTLTIQAVVMAALASGKYAFDFQVAYGARVRTPVMGFWIVTDEVTRATS